MRAPVQLMAQLTIPVPPQKALQLELTVPYLSMLHQQLPRHRQLLRQLMLPSPRMTGHRLTAVPHQPMLHQQLHQQLPRQLMLPSPRMTGHRLTAVTYQPMLHQQLPRQLMLTSLRMMGHRLTAVPYQPMLHQQLPRQLMLPSPHMMGHRLTAVTYLSVRLGTLRQMRQQLLSCRPVTALMPVLPAPQPAPLIAARAQQAVLPGMGLIMRTA